MNDIHLLRLPDVLERVPVCKSTLWGAISAGRFPAPIKLSRRCSAWPAAEVEAVAAAMVAGATEAELKALVRQLAEKRKASAEAAIKAALLGEDQAAA